MPNTGKSGGCKNCRQRHIKCDEARPICSYCSRRQLPCNISESQSEATWKNQNEKASQSVQRRLETRDKADIEETVKLQLARQAPAQIPVMSENYIDYGLNFFFQAYVFRPLDVHFGEDFLHRLHPVWIDSAADSPLRPAITATALCLLEAWSFLDPNSPRSLARPHLFQAIRAVRGHLESSLPLGDDVLLAILMLHMYEGVTSFCGQKPMKGVHLMGSMAFIENRPQEQNRSELSQSILLSARSQAVSRTLITEEGVPERLVEWSKSVPDAPQTPGFRLEELECEVAMLWHALARLQKSFDNKYQVNRIIWEKANQLDWQLVEWRDGLSAEWEPESVTDLENIPQSVRAAGCYRDLCFIYSSVFVARVLNQYYIARAKVQLVILACLPHLGSPTPPGTSNAQEVFQDMVDNVCASVPFYLGDRIRATRVDERNIQYPRTPSQPVPPQHYTAAAAFAGFMLSKHLAIFLPPHLPMRLGQRDWILSQMMRIRKIYALHAPIDTRVKS